MRVGSWVSQRRGVMSSRGAGYRFIERVLRSKREDWGIGWRGEDGERRIVGNEAFVVVVDR